MRFSSGVLERPLERAAQRTLSGPAHTPDGAENLLSPRQIVSWALLPRRKHVAHTTTGLRVAAIAAVATAGIVMTAGSGMAAASHQGASAAPKKEKEWTQTGTGASITQPDGSMLLVASVENSLDGDGATV